MSKQKDGKQSTWQNYALRILINTASHPLEYAKVLIQIGYEPIPPRPTTTFLGKPTLKLPNIFEYVKYIKSVDGFTGCYRGLLPKLCGNLACIFTTEKILEKVDEEERKSKKSKLERSQRRKSVDVTESILNRQIAAKRSDNKHSDSLNEEEDKDLEIDEDDEKEEEPESPQMKLIKTLKRDLISRVAAIVISHPFHVITIRMMAEFVGKEVKYSGLFSSIMEVYRQNGIMGFFNGIIPRLVGDVIFVFLATTLTYAANTYITDDTEIQMYTSATMSLIASAATYPFQLVSNCMTVSNSGLLAGHPPRMPIYSSWLDCWSDLSRQSQLKRGSSLLVRYYVGPQVIIGGRAVPILRNEEKVQ